MNAKILTDDPSGRWNRGEIGKVLENDFPKYDFFIELSGTISIQISNNIEAVRRYYFFAHEIELIE